MSSAFVTSVVFNNDGFLLVSGSGDQTIKLWNTHAGQIILTLKGHTADVYNISLSVDGLTLASGSKDQTI